MSEGQFKHIEDKIKEAAGHMQPGFDEHAWEKMAAILDNEKDNKRRFPWWAFLFVLIAGLVILLKYLPVQTGQQPKPVIGSSTAEMNPNTIAPANEAPAIVNDNILAKQLTIEPADQHKLFSAPNRSNQNVTPIYDHKENGLIDEAVTTTDEKNSAKLEPTENTSVDLVKEESSRVTQDGQQKEEKEINQLNKKTGAKPKKNNSFSRLYLTATGGPDASGSRLFSYQGNQVSAKFGLGIGYQFRNNLSLETGFYFGAKKYIAGPKEYKYSANSYWNTVDLLRVDADCFVYEIPLLLRYDFAQKPTTLYYASGGFVSYIMKKEDYVYDYLKNGEAYTSARSYKGNSHFLSALQLSVGIEKKLSDKFALLAAPSVTVPINGIGNGKVKLHSISLQAGIKYRPFRK